MKILRMRADGFGPLRGEFTFSPDRLTLVVDENERGKSSLLAAVHAALYGLDDDRRGHRADDRARALAPLERRHLPSRARARVRGERYVVVRDFERDQTEVWTSGGREVTNDFREGKAEFPIGRSSSVSTPGVREVRVRAAGRARAGHPDGRAARRRDSTLRARLEHAADARLGDTNADRGDRGADPGRRRATRTASSAARSWSRTRSASSSSGAPRSRPSSARSTTTSRGSPSRWQELARLADEEGRGARRHEPARARLARATRRGGRASGSSSIARTAIDLARLLGRGGQRWRGLDPGDPVVAGTRIALASRAGELARLEREIDRVSVELDAACAAVAARGFDPARVEELARRFASLPYDQQALLARQSRATRSRSRARPPTPRPGGAEGEATLTRSIS